MKTKDIITCLSYKKNRIPTFMIRPLWYFMGGFILILVVATLVALIPELRPRIMWLPSNDAIIPKVISRLVVFYPVTILMGLFNPSGRQLGEFTYHWIGMENVCCRFPFTNYATGLTQKPNEQAISEFSGIFKDYFAENFNLGVIARNHRIYLFARTLMFWLCNIAIIAGLIYVGYIAGVLYHRNFSGPETDAVSILLNQLIWAPMLGFVMQWLLLYIFPMNDMWFEDESFDKPDEANARAYLRKYNLEGEINDDI